jgi:tyrosine-protein kinase
MKENSSALEQMLRVLKRRKFVILAALISVPLFAYLYSSTQTTEYSAGATLLFESESEPGLSEATREAATIEALALLPEVAVKAAKELNAPLGEVLGKIEVGSANENANLTTISASNESPERAAEIANAYANSFISFQRQSDRSKVQKKIAEVEAQIDHLAPSERSGAKGIALGEQLTELEVEETLQTGNTSLVQEARPPSTPAKPKTKRNVIVGIIFGLVLGLGLAAAIERFDRRLRTVDDMEALFGLPIIARIPRSKAFQDTRIDEMLQVPEGEAFRTLRTNLKYLNVNRELDSILIASAEPNDGKSTVARGLAGAMVEMGDDVVLVEADLRKPSGFLPVGRSSEGLSGVLTGTPLDRALIEVPVMQGGSHGDRWLWVLPSGAIPPNPSELLESEKMVEVLEALGERFGTVVVDSPAVGVVSDALALVPRMSAVLAVGGIGKTSRDDAEAFIDQLRLTGHKPLGLIVTMTPTSRNKYAYYNRARPPLMRR